MSSGAKKEKSFNGTKAKFSPNAAVPEKKAEVKLRRKESEKVKQPSDPNRKSVLGRFFHNLVDSDDSRKKAAAADAKKKKGRDAVGSDLDLPEHGIVLRKPQTLQRDQQLPGAIPSPRTRAMTLANQGGRDNRNRWSSYDIQASNFTEGMLPPTVPETDYSTMGHRSQSEETLNALLMADPPRSMSKVKDSFITHSDSARQPDTMRKHAQLLQSIQETKANRSSRSDKTIDARSGQGSNGYLLTTEMVIDGPKKDASSITGNNSDQKLNDLQKASSCDSADGNRELRPQNQTATSSSDALVLLDEKNKQIDKAMADKRKILSQLFGVAEADLNNLLEKDVDLSTDLSVRKMILISLLQSDQLTSAISGLLVPLNSGCTDGAVDKEAAVATGDKCLKEKASSQSQLLHKVASRLHSHLTLLQQIVDRDVAETDRLKKDLEEAQLQIKKKSMPPEAKVDLPEVSLDSDKVVEQSADLSVSTEAQGGSFESLSNTVDNVPESTSKQDTQTMVNTDQNVADKKEKAEEVLPLVEELVYITEHVKEEQLFSADTDDKTDIKLSSDVSQNVSPHVDECIETADAEVHTANEVIVLNDKDTSGHQQESVPSGEINTVHASSDESVKDVIVPAEVKEDYQTDFQDVNDNLEKLLDEADEAGDQYHLDSNRKFMNLESIPEDDDRLSCCDVELKVCASENLYQELVLKCHIEVTVEDEVETIFSTEVETKSDLKDDARPIIEDNIQSNFTADFLPGANDVQSAVADDVQVSMGDAQSDVKTDSLLNTPDDFQAIVDNARSNLQDVAPSSVGNTPLHVHSDIQSSAADDARSHAQKDARSDTEDDPRSNLDKIQASAGDGEDSCQVPVIIADVNRESGDNLQERESALIEEKFPQILAGPESLKSQEEEEEEEEHLEGETEQDDLESDTDTETSMQLEKKSGTESETDEELESEDEEESDVLKMLETALLESDSKEESKEESLDLEAERRLAVDSENASEQILNGPDIASDQLMQVEEISFSDSILEERETAEINEPKAVVDSSLHNHVEKESVERDEGFSHENTKSEISEVVSELLDLNECDKITIVSSGKE